YTPGFLAADSKQFSRDQYQWAIDVVTKISETNQSYTVATSSSFPYRCCFQCHKYGHIKQYCKNNRVKLSQYIPINLKKSDVGICDSRTICITYSMSNCIQAD